MPEGEARDQRISFLVNADEYAEIQRLSGVFGESISEWIRQRSTTVGPMRARGERGAKR